MAESKGPGMGGQLGPAAPRSWFCQVAKIRGHQERTKGSCWEDFHLFWGAGGEVWVILVVLRQTKDLFVRDLFVSKPCSGRPQGPSVILGQLGYWFR